MLKGKKKGKENMYGPTEAIMMENGKITNFMDMFNKYL